jgi:hypothetical protein
LRNIRDRSSGFPVVAVPGGTERSMLMPGAEVKGLGGVLLVLDHQHAHDL